jgi:hypothetical protein
MTDGPVSAVTNRDELAMHVESALAHIADYGRAESQADRAGDRTQIIPFGAVLAPFTRLTAVGVGHRPPPS